MALSTQPYKGARDFYPQDKRLQKYIFGKMRAAAEKFGYEEYDAPVLEPLELYLAKTSEEIVGEQVYNFTDRGGRQVVIRPEMTPTVSRMVAARRQELAYPLRLYSIPNLWRYERPQRGRLREHWQFNADIFGVEGVEAELEVIQLADEVLKSFGAKRSAYAFRLSSRRLSDAVLTDYLGLDAEQSAAITRIIDRRSKLDHEDFSAQVDAQLAPHQRGADALKRLLEVLEAKTLSDLPPELEAHEAASKLSTLMRRLHQAGITNAQFDPSLVRGFDYYTDVVFETYDTHPDNNRSMFGGGRYDGLVGLFGVEPLPTVGFGMGDVTLMNFLELHGLLPELASEVDATVVLIGDIAEAAQPVLKQLREELNLAVDISGKAPDKQLKSAVKRGIPYVIIIGTDELQSEQFKLKNLQTGQEEAHSVPRLISLIKDHRS